MTEWAVDAIRKHVFDMCASYIDASVSQDIPVEIRRYIARKGKEFRSLLFPYSTDEQNVFRKIFRDLHGISYAETDENVLVAKISQIIDVAHCRGSLAGVFIEGGASTCAKASNLAPDEVYESLRDAAVEYWAHMLDDCRF